MQVSHGDVAFYLDPDWAREVNLTVWTAQAASAGRMAASVGRKADVDVTRGRPWE